LLCLENEYFDLAELMVSKGAELNIRNDNGWTPLIWASIKGRKKSVEFLLKHKANINVCNNDGWNAITGAYFKKRTDIVKILKENGAIFSAKYAEAALLSAYQNGYLDIVNQLLDDGISPNVSDDGNSLLILSAKNGDLVLVDKLIKVGADVNYNSTQGLLSILSTNGYDEQIELAIKAGAYINRKDDTNRSALYLAVMGNRVSTVKLLIDAGADVNVTSKSGYTPLLITAHYGYLELAKLLKENNANLEAKVDGRNAIGHALYRYKKTTEPVDRMCKQVSELLLNEG
jgi:ankyrin repeat protein